jgi:hypothetical protein
MRLSALWRPVIISVILTPIFLFLAVISAGAGHGNYFFAKVLFPFTMLSTIGFHSITAPFMLLAIVQFPIYGIVLGRVRRRERLRRMSIWLITLHSLAVLACLLFVDRNFS